jgi:hypothetical protein
MFDLRYHVASLAAVFVALVIGILVGVAISSNSSVSNPERQLLEGQKADLRAQLGSETALVAQLAQGQRGSGAIAKAAYPLVMHDRLKGKRIGVILVGPSDSRLRGLVQTALEDAGALPAVRFRALKVPIDPASLQSALEGRPALAALADPTQPEAVGRELAREFVRGGKVQFWTLLAGQLVSEQSGGQKQPLDGVVVVRTAAAQQGATARFLAGFYGGLGSAGAILAGVEATGSKPSALPTFRRLEISSVDDLETPAGRLALAALLAGAAAGHYGLAAGDTAVLPPIEPVVVTGG